MEAFTSDKECIYYMKLLTFTLGIGMEVLHNYFEQKILNAMEFYAFLEKYKHYLFHECYPKIQCCECQKQKVLASSAKSGCLNKSQFKLLFDMSPPTETDHYQTGRHNEIIRDCLCRIEAKSSNEVDCMDITLMWAIITSCFLNNNRSIHGDPRDLYTIKKTRNFLAHATDLRVSEADFNKLWAETEQAILGIASAVGNYFAKANKRKIEEFKSKDLSLEKIKGIIENNADEEKKNLLTLIENQRKTAELVKQGKSEIMEEMKKYYDQHTIDIGKLRFDIKQQALPRSISPKEEALNTRDFKKCRVEWKLKTPDTWDLTDIKKKLLNCSQLLRKYFEIECVFVGSLVIKTLVQQQVLENRDQMRVSVHLFLEKIVEVCKIKTDVPEVIQVSLKIEPNECGYEGN
ncbi:Hypothetical predicted protein [Mytilus galloprovincialis]|uniref:DZIP3-like HEPN domain-containing protein n=1 Tax=Mytilus galloprovincialis TaxID=29158 RepID=A0A8B6FPU7_MYTGA|nr:Hypothetical predicted protein [Mytilus galloprovincialis]